MANITLSIPSNELIAKYIHEFNENDRYFYADKAIDKLIGCFPQNKTIEDVLLKVVVINRLYSTSVYGVNEMAEHILSQDIDIRLKSGDLSLVDAIATGHGIPIGETKKERCFYSFATKYCNWHNKKSYPIYDSFVDKILFHYMKQDKFSEFKRTDLRDYSRFSKIVADFIEYYSITDYGLKELDKFLWRYGQEMFP